VMLASSWRREALVPTKCHLESKNSIESGAISSSVDADQGVIWNGNCKSVLT
jgi:hypothetical protein